MGLHALDEHITRLGWTRLEREGTRLVLECVDEDVERAIVLLARAGAAATRLHGGAAALSGLVPALVRDLAPRSAPGVIDRVSVRRIDLAEATTRIGATGRWNVSIERWHMSLRRGDPAPLRALLRGQERLFAWRRVLWARPAVLRSGSLRGIRPVIFDREAVERVPERHAFVLADELTRWAIG
ncbi:MAG: hypothetical protein M3R54_04770 [Chloroflexota bacterium]|nr:hypothetical protein [Chloroflexota bacterium]